MPQEQRNRIDKSYMGDSASRKFGYPPYNGKINYCDDCQNYNDDGVDTCEICGRQKLRPIDLKYEHDQPEEGLIKKLTNTEIADPKDKLKKFTSFYQRELADRKSEHLRQIVFTPAAEPDALTNALSYNLARKGELYLHGDTRSFHGDTNLRRVGQPVLQPGARALGCLSSGGRLYVVGHGNAGGAIGNHEDNVGARSLVQLLLREGMPKAPKKPITIWLFACATGASVNLGYVPIPFYRKAPFVQRFAEALLANGCLDFYVVGFAGFVGADGDICTKYILDDNKSERREWRLTDSDERVVYRVANSAATRIKGGDFVQKTDFKWLGNPKKWNYKNTKLKVSKQT